LKHFLFISLLVCLINISFSQVRSDNNSTSKTDKEIYILNCKRIEIDACVDIKHWQNYLAEKLELDSLAQDTIPPCTYQFTAQILIGKNGCIEQVKIIDDPGYGLGDKAIRVILAYQQWQPAEMNGRRVRAYRRQPITIVVEKKECEEKLPIEFIF